MANTYPKSFELAMLNRWVWTAKGRGWAMLQHRGLGARINAGQRVVTDPLCLLSDTDGEPPLDTLSVQCASEGTAVLSSMVVTVYGSLDGMTWKSIGETVTGDAMNYNIDATGLAYVRAEVTTDNGADATWRCTLFGTRFLA